MRGTHRSLILIAFSAGIAGCDGPAPPAAPQANTGTGTGNNTGTGTGNNVVEGAISNLDALALIEASPDLPEGATLVHLRSSPTGALDDLGRDRLWRATYVAVATGQQVLAEAEVNSAGESMLRFDTMPLVLGDCGPDDALTPVDSTVTIPDALSRAPSSFAVANQWWDEESACTAFTFAEGGHRAMLTDAEDGDESTRHYFYDDDGELEDTCGPCAQELSTCEPCDALPMEE